MPKVLGTLDLPGDEIDSLKCPKCGAWIKIIALIQEWEEIIRF
jgi:hypothetical protein